MMPIPSVILTVVLLALSALHAAWALGIRWGLKDAIPELEGKPLFKPGRGATLLVAAALLAGAGIVAWPGFFPETGLAWVPRARVWGIAVLFPLRAAGDFRYCGFFKRIRGTAFARKDSLFYSPLCAIISALAVWLAVGYG